MERRDNYAISAQNAKKLFLSYDQQKLIDKLNLKFDDAYLYTTFLGSPYRIARSTGDLQRRAGEAWVDGNSFDEVLTLFDLVCDSAEARTPAHRWKNMTDFGLQFHQNLMESRDPLAEWAQAEPEAFRGRCWPWGQGKSGARTLPLRCRCSICWKWLCFSGRGTRSSPPESATCGMKTPCSISAMRPCTTAWAACGQDC